MYHTRLFINGVFGFNLDTFCVVFVRALVADIVCAEPRCGITWTQCKVWRFKVYLRWWHLRVREKVLVIWSLKKLKYTLSYLLILKNKEKILVLNPIAYLNQFWIVDPATKLPAKPAIRSRYSKSANKWFTDRQAVFQFYGHFSHVISIVRRGGCGQFASNSSIVRRAHSSFGRGI